MYIYEEFEKVAETIQTLIDEVTDKAKEEFGGAEFEGEYPDTGFGISTLRPQHVRDSTPTLPDAAIDNWRTTIGTAQTWEDWVNLTIDEDTFVIIEGFFNRTPSPSVTELWWKASGSDRPIQNIEIIYTYEEPKGYLSAPFAVGPKKGLQIQLYGRTAQVELIGMIGHAVARQEILITT